MQGGPSSGQGQHESQMFQHLKDQAQHGNDASQASDKKKFLACLLTTLLTVSNCHYSKKDSIPTIILILISSAYCSLLSTISDYSIYRYFQHKWSFNLPRSCVLGTLTFIFGGDIKLCILGAKMVLLDSFHSFDG